MKNINALALWQKIFMIKKKGMLNSIKTQKIDNYILKDDVFAAISYFGNPIILTVASKCEGEITCS